ncbi:unnamed protein product, partial [marine sediment metagenome]
MLELVHNDTFLLKTVLPKISEAKTLSNNYDLTQRITRLYRSLSNPFQEF